MKNRLLRTFKISMLVQKQDFFSRKWHFNPIYKGGNILLKLHHTNFKQWHEENVSRRENSSDNDIVKSKKNIDRLNLIRNKLVDKIDSYFYSFVKNNDKTLPWDAGTPGSIIDRLSVSSLKLYHVNLEARTNKGYSRKISLLRQQRNDLAIALAQLINELLANKKQLRLYINFKFYQD